MLGDAQDSRAAGRRTTQMPAPPRPCAQAVILDSIPEGVFTVVAGTATAGTERTIELSKAAAAACR